MSVVTVIGDVHGKTGTYQKICRRLPAGQRSIQIGDMGIGFPEAGLHKMELHKFFRGNHDNPQKCQAHANYLGDWGYEEETGIFWVAGARSIDWKMRVPGRTWWPDEELSYAEFVTVLEAYIAAKPRFMLTHEAPTRVSNMVLHGLLGPELFASKDDIGTSRTSEMLQQAFECWEPEEWIFGHYHVDKTYHVGRTKFTCVAELSKYDLKIAE